MKLSFRPLVSLVLVASSACNGASSSDDASGTVDGGTCAPAPLNGSLDALVHAIVANMTAIAGPGSNALVVPTESERDSFAENAVAALSGDARKACKLPPSYRYFSLRDGADDVLIVAELDASGQPAPKKFWGTYASRKAAPGTRALVVEAPHPLFDPNTPYESRAVFSDARADWFLMAGAHRCANAETSGCDGTSGACGGGESAPYRVSDTAHATKSPFFAVHIALSKSTSDAFLQLHGNTQKCPDALVSDSSGKYDDAGVSAQLAAAIEARGPTVGRCGLDYPKKGTCTLCGTDNVEGRATAGSRDACEVGGKSYGRFVHVEQQPKLRQIPDGGVPGYQPLVDAVIATFSPR